MNHQIYFLGCMILLLTTFGCQPDGDDSGETLVNIPVDFHIDIREDLDDWDRNSLIFSIASTNTYECQNYMIASFLQQTDAGIRIDLNDIVEPADCDELEAGEAVPATEELTLRDLEIGGTPLIINLKGAIQNQGVINVSAAQYSIDMEKSDGISFVHKQLLQVPEDIIWGCLSFEGDGGNAVKNAFFEEIEDRTEEKNIPSGYYGHYSIDNDGLLALKDTATYTNTSTFYYEYTGQNAWLQELIDSYNFENETTKVSLKIKTSNGEEF